MQKRCMGGTMQGTPLHAALKCKRSAAGRDGHAMQFGVNPRKMLTDMCEPPLFGAYAIAATWLPRVY